VIKRALQRIGYGEAGTAHEGDAPKVLIVEDDAALRLLCRINLELDGYRVLEARSVGQAERALSAGEVDLVLLDVHVGPDDGVTLMRSLRQRGHPAPVVLFSGSSQLDSEARAEADGVVPKPFELEELLEVVHRLVRGEVPRR
jgi:DNA-binding response OmpR family regulator